MSDLDSVNKEKKKNKGKKRSREDPYEPNILTKKGFSEGCARYYVTRKEGGLRERCNELLLDSVKQLVDAALLYADSQGDKVLTLEHLKAVAPSVREFPGVLI